MDAQRVEFLRRFMEEDSGEQFIMMNLLDMANNSARRSPGGHGRNMFPQLFRRASHPVFFGPVVFQAMDLVGS